ncbi:MBL fold metallo-hydrolase [Ruminococcus sp. XPD3002]|uniref:MBL fold metallo-hydrolase n=1 Tax=Ruminococcus sp. XPD3002 TaxID=1452269 RepID=UPI000920BCC4|nr:MBL fold metallo-hydrolase [Ruminococcus sp.]MBR6983239.1 MBL fold metallo-hydrolase [Ruminococcus sp.]SFX77410.1 Phosphoribosyl 1,2-cyclic phosphodiesterase [Ruminococcus flavefaciens]
MARIYPLFSSSKGNSTFIGTEQGGILIDCGVSFKRLSAALEVNRIPLSAVQAVFITHEHSDHVTGLKMLTKHTGMPVYGQKRTLQRLCDSDKIAANSPVIDMNGITINCGGCEVRCFNTPHDTIQSCGYRIHTSDDKHCAVCTDLGHITPEVDEALTGCRLVLLEANYDEEMLRNGPYPLYLKERILSCNGHLSNTDSGAQVRKLVTQGTTHIILGHLSQDNNRPYIADKTVESCLSGMTRGRDYLLGVAPVETQGGAVIF